MTTYVDAGILGSGIAFPLRLEDGKIGLNSADAQVEQSIRLILSTGRGERIMRPDFGGGLEQLVFEPMNAVTATLLQRRIVETLQRFEPRIQVLNVNVVPDDVQGQLRAEIQYEIRRSGSVFNMVFPFYLAETGI